MRVSRLLPPTAVDTLPKKLGTMPRLVRRSFGADFADRHHEFAKAGACMAWYSCRFRCSEAMKLQAVLGYDGPVRVWIDGRACFTDPHGTNPACPTDTYIPFAAKRGTHEIVVALDSNGGRAWGIYLRFKRLDIRRGTRAYAMPEWITGSDPK
jgi:hypothetical protein